MYNEIERVTLQKIKFVISSCASKATLDMMKLEYWDDFSTGRIIKTLQFFLWGKEAPQTVEKTFKYPATWWDFFKLRFFPKILRKKFPVKYIYRNQIIRHYYVCPHLNVKTEYPHISFLINLEGAGCPQLPRHASTRNKETEETQPR